MSSARHLLPLEPAGSPTTHSSTCPISFRRSGSPWTTEFLPFAEFRRWVDAAQDLVEVELEGCGEPLLHPRFFDLVEYATRAGLRVSTYTNGTALQRASATRCVTSGLDTLRLVLGAVTATGTSGRARWRREYVLRSVDALVAERARFGSAHPHLHVVVALLRRNVDELPALVERVARHGAEALRVEPLGLIGARSQFPRVYLPTRDCVARESLLRENPERVVRAFEAATETALRVGVQLELPHLPEYRMLWMRGAAGL
jgi:MoaA/NifB/PqqE/SkfB family radical SAM enzyme